MGPESAALLLALLACLLAATHLAERRRRGRVADACHELRRPLQVLALSCEQGLDRSAARQLLAQAGRSLQLLEAELHGRRWGRPAGHADADGDLLAEATARWSAIRELRAPGAPTPPLAGDPVELAAVIDSLIANGLEHGDGGPLELGTAPTDAGAMRIWVRNAPDTGLSQRRRGRARGRGRGLGIASRRAAGVGARLQRPRLTGRGVEAAVEVPVRRSG